MSDKGVAIVTDSTAWMPKELLAQYNIRVAPQVVIIGTDDFEDGVTIQPEEVYTRMKNEGLTPTTSQATIASFDAIFKDLTAEGYTQAVVITISTELSGTYSSAVQAQAMHPNLDLEIIDSRTTAMAMGFAVLAAARKAAAGGTKDEIAAKAHEALANSGVMFTVETLDYLHRGGRIGGAAALFGNVLNMKPVLEVRDGRVEPVQRIRTKKKAMNFIVDQLAAKLDGKPNIQLSTIHALAEEDSTAMMNSLKDRLDTSETYLTQASTAVATHTGPGTVGIAYCYGIDA